MLPPRSFPEGPSHQSIEPLLNCMGMRTRCILYFPKYKIQSTTCMVAFVIKGYSHLATVFEHQVNKIMAAQSTARSSSRAGLVIATGAAILAIASAVVILTRIRNKRQKENTVGGSGFVKRFVQRDEHDERVDPKIVAIFEVAAHESRQLTEISNTEKLILYSLYKQSTESDAPDKAPSLAFIVEKAKYSAWSKLRGMSRTQAMLHYIEAVQQLKHNGSVDTDDMDDVDELAFGGPKPSTLASLMDEEEEGKILTNEQQFFQSASKNNVKELERILSENPKAFEHRDEDGQTALHIAADKGALDALNALLKAGADGNAADGDGITVLQAAVIGENVEACRILLAHGADPDRSDADGDTPRKCAEEDGSDEMKKVFASFQQK